MCVSLGELSSFSVFIFVRHALVSDENEHSSSLSNGTLDTKLLFYPRLLFQIDYMLLIFRDNSPE
jgi:hypothetical protein